MSRCLHTQAILIIVCLMLNRSDAHVRSIANIRETRRHFSQVSTVHLRTVYIVKKFAVLSNEVGAGPEQEDGHG